MNAVQKAIMDRRSTRGFDGTPLTEEELQTLIDAALQSPSAVNRQPWHFSFVKDAALLDEFDKEACAWLVENGSEGIKARYADPSSRFLMGAPLFVVISAPAGDEGFFTKIDCGIAVENLALSAMGLNLGSVIVGMPRMVIEREGGEETKRRLGIPEGNEFIIGILIGHNTVTKEAHPIEPNKVAII